MQRADNFPERIRSVIIAEHVDPGHRLLDLSVQQIGRGLYPRSRRDRVKQLPVVQLVHVVSIVLDILQHAVVRLEVKHNRSSRQVERGAGREATVTYRIKNSSILALYKLKGE